MYVFHRANQFKILNSPRRGLHHPAGKPGRAGQPGVRDPVNDDDGKQSRSQHPKPPATRREDGYRRQKMQVCTYCGSSIETQDEHVIPSSKGGVSTIPACRACNQSKGDKPLMEWLRWEKQNYSYRWNRIKDYNYGRENDIAAKVQTVRDEKR
jgi:hypothetical protein